MYIRYRYWRAWQPIVFLVYLSNHADLAPYHRKQLNIYNSSSHHACISEISVDINLTILKFANVIHAYSNSLKLIENKKNWMKLTIHLHVVCHAGWVSVSWMDTDDDGYPYIYILLLSVISLAFSRCIVV